MPDQFTLDLLPRFATALFATGLAIFGWRRRAVPGALPFAILMALEALWAGGTALQVSARTESAKIFWFKFEYFWQGPIIVVGLCFVLQFARLSWCLNRFTLGLLSAFILSGSLLILTNDLHHAIWLDFSADGMVYSLRGVGSLFLNGIGLGLALLNLPILLWLFIRSPQHRLPVAFILCGQLAVRLVYLFWITEINPEMPTNFDLFAVNFSSIMYVIALFGFRIFDPIPMARRTVIEQMREGMIVLDTQWNIVDLNVAAEKILGASAARIKGRALSQIVAAAPELRAPIGDAQTAPSEVTLGTGAATRIYALHFSPLNDARGFSLGYLILLHDVTKQKRAQHQLVEQQRVVATLEERARLARELHDTLVQATASIRMQAETANVLLARGDTATTRDCLARLADMAHDTHLDLREYIFETSAARAAEENFFAALRAYLAQFSQRWAIQTRLRVPAEFEQSGLGIAVETQLLRIIQESLANVRKHSSAHCAQIVFARAPNGVQLCIEDDGCGFDLARDVSGFGIRSMRERAQTFGGAFEIQSAPGKGTRIVVTMPDDPKFVIRHSDIHP
ncbi:MAG: PAS domain S-box protein [Chloroflexi bacterium]|nr:PAS domain S-box protein [Chloroflexota bacterium]